MCKFPFLRAFWFFLNFFLIFSWFRFSLLAWHIFLCQVSYLYRHCISCLKLATVVEGNPKAPFSVASFPVLLHFTLDTYLVMLDAKQGSIEYHFLSLWYDSTWDWTPVSQAIGFVGKVFANDPGDLGVVAIEKGAFRSPSTIVTNFTYYILLASIRIFNSFSFWQTVWCRPYTLGGRFFLAIYEVCIHLRISYVNDSLASSLLQIVMMMAHLPGRSFSGFSPRLSFFLLLSVPPSSFLWYFR